MCALVFSGVFGVFKFSSELEWFLGVRSEEEIMSASVRSEGGSALVAVVPIVAVSVCSEV